MHNKILLSVWFLERHTLKLLTSWFDIVGRKIRKSSHVDGVVHYEIVNLSSAEDILNALAYYSFLAGMVT